MSGGECFNCADPAVEQYAVILPDGKVLQDKYLCDVCLDEFREEDWLEVHEGPVLTRGEDGSA